MRQAAGAGRQSVAGQGASGPTPPLRAPSSTVKAPAQPETSLARRQLLGGLAAGAAIAAAPRAATAAPAAAPQARAPGDWTTPGLAVPEDPSAPRFFRTASGVKVQELARGAGPSAAEGDTVLFDYTLRRADGYFVYATVEGASFQPRDVPVGPVSFRLGGGQLVPGLEETLIGMQPGGRRRALVPPEQGYTSSALGPQPPTFATRRQLANHSREPLLFEVELLRVNAQR
ncbi:hypothetical protein Rsub_11834 [Raphidocelis subcapitata]|uniref:peptidylprolyl isomerase n=1 Tax=Raphidocelis subcapitata TaxID=307507 RepID=A0A2V0PLW8_9CHLO|nr:hypothetical protein Rsub_11834 [Raphidocelis subcapitata]|eukprot:GBF99063.1 hypothetical protein Rsub_11834 [Raphidocelis subcapitata]